MQNDNQPQQASSNSSQNPEQPSESMDETIHGLPPQPVVFASDEIRQPTMPVSSGQFQQQLPYQQPSKWRYFFFVLGILQLVGVGMFVFVMSWAIQQAKAGVSGTEFIGLALFATLVPAVGLIALINLVGLPIYMRKRRPHGKGLVLGILSFAISALLAVLGGYSFYQLNISVPQEARQAQRAAVAQRQQFLADNAKPEINKDEAVRLLQTCQLKGFYYTDQTSRSDGEWGQLSSTGVVLTKVDGKPYRISIADSLTSELVPIARAAQKSCGGPQFWHDGSYEQYQNGHWYFKGQVVN